MLQTRDLDLSGSANVWVLDFVQDKFHYMSSGDYEGTFIKAGVSKIRKILAQKKQQESLAGLP